ncbi:hypothetical protein FVR03_21380 [Pontibacter qinzhouensis]|uniref:Uncharacterized protein n=1 Tax=Pontibacter qinzhouensis TaxID=2603253 RepID=A0A5C8IZ29_9BACT|nr:hypothetical protein [Pontibacter qinzhouensis]TXK26982.1 hypothetical protein FVR03_21380 [Pontibacter qinzhouensis]
MRHNRDENFGDYGRNNHNHQHRRASPQFGYGNNEYRTDRGPEEESHYRRHPQNHNGRREHFGDYRRTQDDFYNRMYDTSNYNAMPRYEDYGRPIGRGDDIGDQVHHFPMQDESYWEEERHLRYNMGYNPNYDNPEEGDSYRNFDSRGNHGYRHDASYGHADEFRDFGNDHYGRSGGRNNQSGKENHRR